MRARILFGAIAGLSQYKRTTDSLLALRDTTIENCNAKTDELKQGIAQLKVVNSENEFQNSSLKNELKTTKKICRRRFFGGTGGSFALGLVTGLVVGIIKSK